MGDADSFSTHFKACAGRMLGLGLWTMFLRCGGAACGGWLGGDEFHLGLLGSGRHRDRSCRLRRFARGQFGGLASLLSELRCGCFRRGCLSRETILLGSCRGGLLSGETFLLDLLGGGCLSGDAILLGLCGGSRCFSGEAVLRGFFGSGLYRGKARLLRMFLGETFLFRGKPERLGSCGGGLLGGKALGFLLGVEGLQALDFLHGVGDLGGGGFPDRFAQIALRHLHGW